LQDNKAQIQQLKHELKNTNEQFDLKLELKLKEATRGSFLKKYFKDKNSILSEHSDVFIDMARKYNLDPLLLPAVSFVESGGCKRYVQSTNNCFGWGGGYIHFKDIPTAIERIARDLNNHSYYRRYQKERTLSAFASNYNPSHKEDYEKKLRYFMNQIKEYE